MVFDKISLNTLETSACLMIFGVICFQKLLAEKVGHDFLVDSSLLCVAVYLSRSVLLRYPLEIEPQLVPDYRLRQW